MSLANSLSSQERNLVTLKEPSVASTLLVELSIPCSALEELMQNQGDLQELGQLLAQEAKKSWLYELTVDQPDFWPELQPKTIEAKRRRGQPFPEQPLRGTGEMERQMETLPPDIAIERNTSLDEYGLRQGLTPGGVDLRIGLGPRDDQDMNPSQRLRDMLYGSPYDLDEASRYGRRGVIPARMLGWDQATRNAVEKVLQKWLEDKGLANDCVEAELNSQFALDTPDPQSPDETPLLPIRGLVPAPEFPGGV